MTWYLIAAINGQHELTDAYTMDLAPEALVQQLQAAARADHSIALIEAYEITYKQDAPLKLAMRKSLITLWDEEENPTMISPLATYASDNSEEQ